MFFFFSCSLGGSYDIIVFNACAFGRPTGFIHTPGDLFCICLPFHCANVKWDQLPAAMLVPALQQQQHITDKLTSLVLEGLACRPG